MLDKLYYDVAFSRYSKIACQRMLNKDKVYQSYRGIISRAIIYIISTGDKDQQQGSLVRVISELLGKIEELSTMADKNRMTVPTFGFLINIGLIKQLFYDHDLAALYDRCETYSPRSRYSQGIVKESTLGLLLGLFNQQQKTALELEYKARRRVSDQDGE